MRPISEVFYAKFWKGFQSYDRKALLKCFRRLLWEFEIIFGTVFWKYRTDFCNTLWGLNNCSHAKNVISMLNSPESSPLQLFIPMQGILWHWKLISRRSQRQIFVKIEELVPVSSEAKRSQNVHQNLHFCDTSDRPQEKTSPPTSH
jgi:hypothetical protein